MTRNLFVLLLSATVISVVVSYQTRFDHIDVDSIIGNRRILTSFIKCFLDEGPCTGEAKDIKDILPEVVQTRCASCSDTQKRLMAKAINFLITDRPEEWSRLVDKYDPEHVHTDDLRQFLAEAPRV